MNASRGLGKGLSALLGEDIEENLLLLSVDDVYPDSDQPRTVFMPEELGELQDSIAKKGVLQPILVRPTNDGKYIIVAGERRWRAVQNLGLVEIPAIVKRIGEKEAFEMAIIENIQRENLSPLDEAAGYKKLIDQHNYTQEKISEIVSKSRSHIANLLRLCGLSEKTKEYLRKGLISLGHAKILASLDEDHVVADAIVKRNLNVRDAENYIKFLLSGKERLGKPGEKAPEGKITDNTADEISELLSHSLGMPVEISCFKKGAKILIHCETIDQLDLVVRKLSGSVS